MSRQRGVLTGFEARRESHAAYHQSKRHLGDLQASVSGRHRFAVVDLGAAEPSGHEGPLVSLEVGCVGPLKILAQQLIEQDVLVKEVHGGGNSLRTSDLFVDGHVWDAMGALFRSLVS